MMGGPTRALALALWYVAGVTLGMMAGVIGAAVIALGLEAVGLTARGPIAGFTLAEGALVGVLGGVLLTHRHRRRLIHLSEWDWVGPLPPPARRQTDFDDIDFDAIAYVRFYASELLFIVYRDGRQSEALGSDDPRPTFEFIRDAIAHGIAIYDPSGRRLG